MQLPYIRLKYPRLLGADLHLHWSVALAAAYLLYQYRQQSGKAPLAIGCYFGVILLHELGHALFAKRLGYRPLSIYLTAIHGACLYEQPTYEREDVVIAWGGVLLQLAIAVPMVLVGTFTPLGHHPYGATAIFYFGHFSLAMVILNFLPLPFLDGSLAWRIVPIWWQQARLQRQARKTARALFKRFR